MRKSTSRDVAERAGVSRSTVSLVLSGSTQVSISHETRERVRAAAEALNYQPNRAGRMLVRGDTETLGIIVTDPLLLAVDGFIALLLQAIIARSREGGYRVMIDYVSDDSQRTYRDLMHEGAVDGLLVISPRTKDADLSAVIETGFPVVLVGGIGHPDEFSISLPTRQAIRTLVDHLVALGHKRIAYVSFAPSDIFATHVRVGAYTASLAGHGIPFDPALVVHANYSAASGRDAVMALLEAPGQRPTAIMAGNDTVAIGALRAIAEHGLRVPEDVSVVGFDDLPFAACLNPPLTTIHHDADLRAQLAVQALTRRIRGQTIEDRHLEVPAELVVRSSTGHR
ncbi:LacI family DNA-binding transcriptional regulator [Ensifer sp.]|uniref:LacI family DNA-binding transcriptional regulator n=1 Tax=Ensifer sp. TaxID=1872086 RepID=UPI0028A0C6E8|nr:LacI family DNA-binding transcriptional regulator [Ensifer sp.]